MPNQPWDDTLYARADIPTKNESKIGRQTYTRHAFERMLEDPSVQKRPRKTRTAAEKQAAARKLASLPFVELD